MVSLAAQILAVSIAFVQRQEYHNLAAKSQTWNNEYDYIVVGAGSAGSIVASRLSKNDSNSVLLLEAGDAANMLSDIPIAFRENIQSTPDWGYVSTPQKYSSNMFVNNITKLTKAKVIGGSATVNAMIYNRGNIRDFDGWAYKYGAGIQWSFKRLLPYFEKLETFHNSSYYFDNLRNHGKSGLISVSVAPNADPLHYKFQQAWGDAGYLRRDYNGDEQVGTGFIQNNIDPKTWTRSSSAYAYLYPALDRRNLNVIANAHVTRLIINNQTVCGVEFIRNGQTHQIKIKKEVILSAGTIGSAQLLMLSGIGPKKHLEELQIPLVRSLPVGKNIQDHTFADLFYVAKDENDIQWSKMNRLTPQTLYDYYVGNTGPLIQDPTSFVYFSTVNNNNLKWPNALAFMRLTRISEGFYKNTKDPEGWNEFLKPLIGKNNIFNIQTSIFRTYSRGYIKLNSSDPFDNPIIDPALLAHPKDFKAQVDALIYVLEKLDSPYFRNIAEPYNHSIPGCEKEFCYGKHMKSCRKYIECYVRHMTTTSWHLTGSTPMGKTRNFSVVNSKLQVYGIKKLRIIDASVIPEIPNSNTNVAVMAIAELGSHIVLSDQS